ncbi:MAG: ABC transporter permease [Dehalococcoidia bacterium]
MAEDAFAVGAPPAALSVGRGGSVPRIARAFGRSPAGAVGLALVLVAVTVSLLAPAIAPRDPLATDYTRQLKGPAADRLLGTDDLGRDVLSRVLYGGRISLRVSLGAVSIALVVGVGLGLIAGFFGRWMDLALMRLVDAQLAVPGLILAIVLATSLGATLRNVMVAIGVTAVPTFARLTRGEALRVRERDYVLAVRTLGATNARIMARHVLPNIMGPLIVQTSIALAGAILVEASLGFLGLGVPPPAPTWGGLVQQGYPYLEIAPWIVFSSGAAIAVAVLGFSLLGDGLRDTLDPRLRGR